jgi:hypothetical protein
MVNQEQCGQALIVSCAHGGPRSPPEVESSDSGYQVRHDRVSQYLCRGQE